MSGGGNATDDCVSLAIAFHQAPGRFSDLLHGRAELPKGIGKLLRLAGGAEAEGVNGQAFVPAAEKFDQVILDGPPVLGLADAPLLGSLAEATVLVVEASGTGREFARNAVKRLRGTRTRLIGGILTKMNPRGAGHGYYHSYHYYQYGDADSHRRERLPA